MSSILTPTPALLVNERGAPVPPAGLMERMHRTIAPELGLRWIANLDLSTWAVTWEWPVRDLRWARVQSGEISRESAYDILGYLPVECTTDQAASYLEAHLTSSPKEEINKLRAKVAHWNDVEVPHQQVQALMADVMDDVSRESRAPKGQLVSVSKTFTGKKR